MINSSKTGTDNLINNIKKITEKSLMFGVKNVFVSGLVYTTGFDVSLLQWCYILILDLCRKSCFNYIDNRNIRSDSLNKDGLYLINIGKAFLADDFVVYFNNIFLETNTQHPPKNFDRQSFDMLLEHK